MDTKLVQVDIVYLFQLAGMAVDVETPSDVYQKAIEVYQAAHKRVAGEYYKLGTSRTSDGGSAYRLAALAGLAEPRDGAKVFGLWFTSEEEFSKECMLDLTTLCTSYMHDAAMEAGISCTFAGARRVRKFETVEWTDVY